LLRRFLSASALPSSGLNSRLARVSDTLQFFTIASPPVPSVISACGFLALITAYARLHPSGPETTLGFVPFLYRTQMASGFLTAGIVLATWSFLHISSREKFRFTLSPGAISAKRLSRSERRAGNFHLESRLFRPHRNPGSISRSAGGGPRFFSRRTMAVPLVIASRTISPSLFSPRLLQRCRLANECKEATG